MSLDHGDIALFADNMARVSSLYHSTKGATGSSSDGGRCGLIQALQLSEVRLGCTNATVFFICVQPLVRISLVHLMLGRSCCRREINY